jgi:Protein of unknown function (DUF3305)
MTPLASIPVGVVVERRKAKSPWIDFVWRPIAVLPGLPDAQPWTQLDGGDIATFYAGSTAVALFRSEAPRYHENLTSGAPSLWVVLRPTHVEPPYEIVTVTADPSEGEAYTQSGTDLVEAVPLPEPMRAAIAAFVAEHHVAETFYKRERDTADPEALARRRPHSKGETK